MKKTVLLIMIIFTLIPIAGFCEEFTHKKAGITLWFPDYWNVFSENENLIHAEDTSGEVGMIFTIFDADEMKTKISTLDKELEALVDELEFASDKMSEESINGMKALSIAATGKTEGMQVNIGVLLIETPNDKVLMIIGIIRTAHFKKYEKTVDQILLGIRPL